MANISADFVIKLALILVLSILPSLVYLLISKKAKKRWQARIRRAHNFNAYHYDSRSRLNRNFSYGNDSHPQRDRRRPVTKYFIGDTTCINNAHSPYIRCAVNPEGPCNECSHYEKHNSDSRDRREREI